MNMLSVNHSQTTKLDKNKMSGDKDRDRLQPYLDLIATCQESAQYFAKTNDEFDRILGTCLERLAEEVETALKSVKRINRFAHEYDYSPDLPANGYRTLLIVTHACIDHMLQLCHKVFKYKTTFRFYKREYLREIEAYKEVLQNINLCHRYVKVLREWSEPGNLIDSSHTILELFKQEGFVRQFHIYGRCAGFQYCKSVRRVLLGVVMLMTIFSEFYYSHSNLIWKIINTTWNGVKYLLYADSRAQRMMSLTTNTDVHFCKSFWFLSESQIFKMLPDFLCASVEVSVPMRIPANPLFLEHLQSGRSIDIPIPSSHVGPSPISAYLISAKRREGMIGSHEHSSVHPLSDSLIIHFHSGGFIACNCQAHELYFRDWTNDLDIPILCVKYSLAPEVPCPRAVEEAFYAYCWALKNSHLLGWTGKRIILYGESAGANLALGAALKCIRFGIRIPDGLFLAYPPLQVNNEPSPSRLLGLMEAAVPVPFLLASLHAYVSSESLNSDCDEIQNLRNGNFFQWKSVKSPSDPFIAPYFASDEYLRRLPSTTIVCGELDVCLDECVMFAKKIKSLNVDLTLDVMKGLPHGFLNFAKTCKEIDEGVLLCRCRLADLLTKSPLKKQ